MKKGLFLVAGVLTAITISSCKSDSEADETPEDNVIEEICTYTYDSLTTVMEWTGYKTTSKVGVKGTFNDMEITGTMSSDDPMALIESLEFSAATASVETNDEGRNLKLAKFFFGAMEDTEKITASVKELKDNGKAIISIKMNGASVDVEGDYTMDNGKFTYNATIDMSSWDALGAVDSISQACKEKHTGDDGELKTWSEVAIMFSTQLSSDCDQ